MFQSSAAVCCIVLQVAAEDAENQTQDEVEPQVFSKKLFISNYVEVSDEAASGQVQEGEEEEEEAGPNSCDRARRSRYDRVFRDSALFQIIEL